MKHEKQNKITEQDMKKTYEDCIKRDFYCRNSIPKEKGGGFFCGNDNTNKPKTAFYQGDEYAPAIDNWKKLR